MSEHPNKQPTDRWQRVISDALENRDMLDVKLDLMRRLRAFVRAPNRTSVVVPWMIWRLNAEEDVYVKVEGKGVFSAWIEGKSEDKTFLKSGTAEQLIDVLIPLLGREDG